ncbi:DUF1822 family protein [Scytonema hofmannii FACHB-248]|uniref:DUF1822 family protein n=1 Tax=Scytonema hofmannii FACHB-248 TaxID=1842502 RepID=A0ABR8GUA5_9CYAN|nr:MULTISPECIES: DUF1822 family protein [Nostocales]MBD2607050.1 DUF1822 family protein [Scytonema hofmannii FACHB-248]
MTNLSINPQPTWFDFERLPTSAITLSPDQINQAIELSNQIINTNRQWQVYLNSLALFALEEWLESRDTSLTINREKCTLFQPAVANAIYSVSNLQVGEFKLCLIATGSLTDEEVTLSRAVVDIAEYVAHFYILVEVLEEQECAVIQGFLSYQQLTERLANSNLVAEEDWTYQLPLTWFEDNSDRLLLYLRCLEPQAIPLPAVPPRAYNLSGMQNELTALLPQLHSPERELWQVLNWEQGTAILTSPELLNWVYNLQIQQLSIPHLSDLFKLLTQPALNVGRWLWDELDNLAQELSWVLLPGFAPIGEMRSPTEEFAAIITQLQQTDSEIPLEARAAFKDLLLAGIQLRLYAVTWHLVSESNRSEWTLLLILGAPNSNSLPHNVKLRVSDQTGILVERGLEPENGDVYIFTRVIGNWDEKFLVSVRLMDGVEVTLPPFAFDLGR